MTADVLAALEAATEGSRELDGMLAELVGWRRTDSRTHWVGPDAPNVAVFDCPGFTRSLDAALTLVPSGAAWAVMPALLNGLFQAAVDTNFRGKPDWVVCNTPALALCIAALRIQARHG